MPEDVLEPVTAACKTSVISATTSLGVDCCCRRQVRCKARH